MDGGDGGAVVLNVHLKWVGRKSVVWIESYTLDIQLRMKNSFDGVDAVALH